VVSRTVSYTLLTTSEHADVTQETRFQNALNDDDVASNIRRALAVGVGAKRVRQLFAAGAYTRPLFKLNLSRFSHRIHPQHPLYPLTPLKHPLNNL